MRLVRQYYISGRVQGVGFRYFVQSVAWSERIDGWARNLPDGRVEILAEGDRDALERFEAQVRRGPAAARVDDVETVDSPSALAAGGFFIRQS